MNTWKLPANWVEQPREPFLDPDARGRYRIPLRVHEPSGLERKSHPITSGVPLPEGALKDVHSARVLDEHGRELPLQAQALARWPDGSVKWLLLDFQVDLKPNESLTLTLEFGPGTSTSVRHSSPVSIRESKAGIEVHSGNLKVQISHPELPFGLCPVFTARSTDGVRDGRYVGKAEDIRVEESGPLRAAVRVAGWHYREDGRKSMPWIVRFTAWAGVPVLGVQHTFIISDDPLATFWRGIGWEIPDVRSRAIHRAERRGTIQPAHLRDESRYYERSGIACVQLESGTFAVLVRDRERLLPKEFSYDPALDTLGIYVWPLHGEEMDLRSVLVRQPSDFQAWKAKYPDMFERLEGGPMTPQDALDFFTGKKPCTAMGDWRARTGKGVARTHDLFLTTEAADTLRPFDKPLFAICPPSWYAHTAAMGRFHPRDDANFPEIERAIETHLGWLYRHQHEWQPWDNFWDYGDYLGVYDVRRGEWWKYDDGMRGWNNGEVNTDHGPFLQFLRTGDRRHLDFAEAIARHRMDCDQCHFEDEHPEFVGGIHRHHMTEHWTGLIDGGHQWNDGMIDLYYLTGMRRALECAVEVAEFALRYGIAYAVNRADTSRETNNCLRILARTFEATGDERYREAADDIARAYLCSFDENGAEVPLEESLARLRKEFAGSKWEKLPEILEYNWHGHAGYQYIGYLAPAVQYAASLCPTPSTLELARRIDVFAGSIQGDAGQFFGERYLETGDARHLIPMIRNLPAALSVPSPMDGKGDQPGSYGDARLDYLYGTPYVLAALYQARNEFRRFASKPSAHRKGYRIAPGGANNHAGPVPLTDPYLKKNASSEANFFKWFRTHFIGHRCIDLAAVANKDPRQNPFGRPLKDDDAKLLPDLKPGQIGFQPYKGDQLIHDGYRPVSAHQMYPSTASTVTPNQFGLAGLPYGGEITWGGVPCRFVNPDANYGRAIIVLGANNSVTIPIRQTGERLHLLGHVHGRKESRRISQYAQVPVGWYELRYANGDLERVELINGVHFDSIFGPAYATGVEHVANFDWLHVYANLTDDQSHLNKMVLPLRDGAEVESLTFRSTDEDWGLLLAAVTMEYGDAMNARDDECGRRLRAPIGGLSTYSEAGRRAEAPPTFIGPPFETTFQTCQAHWSDLPGWFNVKERREVPNGGTKLFAPCRVTVPLADGVYEVEFTVSGDPEGCPRLRIENNGRQVLADTCLAAGEQRETIRFLAATQNGALALDLIPGQNYATGSLFPERGFTGQYGAWWSPQGNFTRVENLRVRKLDGVSALPVPAGIRYGWLLPGASAETLHGLIVDHEDADGNSATTMKWKAGGFRADVANGRYRVVLYHSTYAPLNTVIIDLFANGKQVCREREVAEEVFEFEAEATDGYIQIEWRQPRTHSRVPRYAIRGIVLERVD